MSADFVLREPGGEVAAAIRRVGIHVPVDADGRDIIPTWAWDIWIEASWRTGDRFLQAAARDPGVREALLVLLAADSGLGWEDRIASAVAYLDALG